MQALIPFSSLQSIGEGAGKSFFLCLGWFWELTCSVGFLMLRVCDQLRRKQKSSAQSMGPVSLPRICCSSKQGLDLRPLLKRKSVLNTNPWNGCEREGARWCRTCLGLTENCGRGGGGISEGHPSAQEMRDASKICLQTPRGGLRWFQPSPACLEIPRITCFDFLEFCLPFQRVGRGPCKEFLLFSWTPENLGGR